MKLPFHCLYDLQTFHLYMRGGTAQMRRQLITWPQRQPLSLTFTQAKIRFVNSPLPKCMFCRRKWEHPERTHADTGPYANPGIPMHHFVAPFAHHCKTINQCIVSISESITYCMLTRLKYGQCRLCVSQSSANASHQIEVLTR